MSYDKELIEKVIRFLETFENIPKFYWEDLYWEDHRPYVRIMGHLRVVNGEQSMWRVSFGLFDRMEIPEIDKHGNWKAGSNVISFDFDLGGLEFWSMPPQIDTLLQRVMKITMSKNLKNMLKKLNNSL